MHPGYIGIQYVPGTKFSVAVHTVTAVQSYKKRILITPESNVAIWLHSIPRYTFKNY